MSACDVETVFKALKFRVNDCLYSSDPFVFTKLTGVCWRALCCAYFLIPTSGGDGARFLFKTHVL